MAGYFHEDWALDAASPREVVDFDPRGAGLSTRAWLQMLADEFEREIGVLLPSLTRIQPALSAYAALGCAALQGCAIVFHLSRGEAGNTPFNLILLALSIFVFWGRRFRASRGERALHA